MPNETLQERVKELFRASQMVSFAENKKHEYQQNIYHD